MTNKLRGRLLEFCLWCWVRLIRPWILARFYASWDEYQKNGHYRARLAVGFSYAFDMFFQNKAEQDYMLKRRLEREPRLRWRIVLFPWSVSMPVVLETAASSGIFSQSEANRF